MKKIRLLLFAILPLVFLFVSELNAQGQEKEFKYVVKINPLAAAGGPFWIAIIPMTGEYKAQFEIATSPKNSFQIGASYIGPGLLLNLDELSENQDSAISGITTSGFRVTGAYKFFMSSDLLAPEGFYMGPYISYASAKIENNDNSTDKLTATKLSVMGIVGYQMISSGGFALDIFTGMGYRKVDWEFNNDATNFDMGGIKNKGGIGLALGFSFGLAF